MPAQPSQSASLSHSPTQQRGTAADFRVVVGYGGSQEKGHCQHQAPH